MSKVVGLDGEFHRFKIPGSSQHPDDYTKAITVNLGQLQVDAAGRLVFIPAEGKIYGDQPKDTSEPSLDSPNCVDDACDGWVNVTVGFPDGTS